MSGGPMLLRFLLVVISLRMLQDALGIGLAKALVSAGGVIELIRRRRNRAT
jgi:hypothetical protein